MAAASYRGTDVAIEPTADGRELLSSWLDDARVLAPPHSGALLGHCAGFRPLAEHASHVCRVSGLPTEREGFSMTIFQALAAGLPILTTRVNAAADWLVEPFRKSDWIDVTWGLRSFGVPRSRLQELQRQWPDAGFHMGLVKQALKRFLTHPWSPLPMFRA